MLHLKQICMKKLLFLAGMVSFGAAHAQFQYGVEMPSPDGGTVIVEKNKTFAITRPFSELAKEFPAIEGEVKAQEAFESKNKKRPTHTLENPNALPVGDDPLAAQGYQPLHAAAPLGANWQAQSGSGYPPDPSGAAGPNHYVQAVNTTYRVYNKTGTPIGNSLNLSSLWSGSTNDGDPIVLYDKYADRWFISQFQVSGNEILVAVSTTSSPTGSYYTWTFVPQASQFPDYFKFSIWQDGYYMAANWNERTVVFDRTAMLAGNSTVSMIVKAMPTTPSNGFFLPLPSDADGQLPPSGTPCYFFSFEDDGWSSSNTDAIRIYAMTTNWTTPANTTMTLVTTLPTTPFNAVFTSSWTDVPQPGSSQKLDVISGVLQYRAQYRRWVGYNTVLLCWPVKVTGLQAGIRWVELRQTGNTWSIYQESTFAPTADYYWMGSMVMDDNGSIGMGYNISNATNISPSLYYTGRIATDPLGQMTVTPVQAVAGSGAQSGIERWGDYAHASLDPDGVTMWYTGEYLTSGAKRTRVFSFTIPSPLDVQPATPEAAPFYNVYQQGTQLIVNTKNMPNNDEVVVDLFDITGKQISGSTMQPTDKGINTTIDVNNLADGTYLVRIGNKDFQKVVKVMVTK